MPLISLRRRPFLALVSLLGLYVEDASASAETRLPSELRNLLSLFQRSRGIEASFVEEKHMALLKAPLKKSGKLYFRSPSSLARVVDKPRRSHLVIKGNNIISRDDAGRKSIDLSGKPALQGLINSLIHVLGGDKQQLFKHYTTSMTGSAEANWQLVLKPKDKNLRTMIESFSLTGKNVTLSKLVISEANGDRTVSLFTNVTTDRRFSPAEIKKYFDI